MNMERSLQSMGLHQQGITRNSLFDQINDLLSLWNPLDVPDYVAGTEYKDYVYDIYRCYNWNDVIAAVNKINELE